jgi:hypothetical protein
VLTPGTSKTNRKKLKTPLHVVLHGGIYEAKDVLTELTDLRASLKVLDDIEIEPRALLKTFFATRVRETPTVKDKTSPVTTALG